MNVAIPTSLTAVKLGPN